MQKFFAYFFELRERIQAFSPHAIYRYSRKRLPLPLASGLFFSIGASVLMLLSESTSSDGCWNAAAFAGAVLFGIGVSQGSVRSYLLRNETNRDSRERKLRSFERLMGAMTSLLFALQAVPGVLAMKWFNDYAAGVGVFPLSWPSRFFLHVEFSAWQAIVYTAFAWLGLVLMLYCCVFRTHGDRCVCTD